MAFQATDLSVLAYANNFTLWHFATADDVVTGAGYFNAASEMLRVNDLIIANVDIDGTPFTEFYSVSGNTDGTVQVSPYTLPEHS